MSTTKVLTKTLKAMKPFWEIKVRYYDDRTRHTWKENVRVVYSTTYKGTDIWREVGGQWYYVFTTEWEYFGTLRETKRFIDNLA